MNTNTKDEAPIENKGKLKNSIKKFFGAAAAQVVNEQNKQNSKPKIRWEGRGRAQQGPQKEERERINRRIYAFKNEYRRYLRLQEDGENFKKPVLTIGHIIIEGKNQFKVTSGVKQDKGGQFKGAFYQELELIKTTKSYGNPRNRQQQKRRRKDRRRVNS